MSLSIVPLIAAGLVPLISGYLWYHPRVFGTKWMQLKHITPEMVERNALRSTEHTLVVLASGLVMAYVLSLAIEAISRTMSLGPIAVALAVWVGVVMPVTLGSVLWDHKPLPQYAIESGQWLFTLIVMCLVLAL